MNEDLTAENMNAICAYCGKPKFQCLCGSTLDISEWRKLISPTSNTVP